MSRSKSRMQRVAKISREDWELVLFYEARFAVLEAARNGKTRSQGTAAVQAVLYDLRAAKVAGVPGYDETGLDWGARP